MNNADGDTDSLNTSIRSISPTPSTLSTILDEPPPYTAVANEAKAPLWSNHDPRNTSTESPPPPSSSSSKRRLLLIYIHGFMGDETSFQSFPAHLHNLVKVLLQDSHEIHTKVYPRFLSRRALEVATNDFSTWLTPHEHPNTDIILVGHSMGGLLASEVALIPATSSLSSSPLKHRLLGTISFDTPYLGMQFGVITSGLSSLFRPAKSPARSPNDISQIHGSQPPEYFRSASLAASEPQDPNFNPAYENDKQLPIRRRWQSAMHFVSKHSQNLTAATNQFVKSYAEFGSCLADYDSLKLRYCRIRMLEDDDGKKRRTVVADLREPPRVRFVNYYTTSSGRPKQSKDQPTMQPWMKGKAQTTPTKPSNTILPQSNLSSASPASTTSFTQADATALNEVMSDTESVSSMSSLSSLDSVDVPSNASDPSPRGTSEPPLSTGFSTPACQPPEPLGPPPRPTDFLNSRDYKRAVISHWRELQLKNRQFRDYDRLAQRQRKLDADRIKYERKKEFETAKDALKAQQPSARNDQNDLVVKSCKTNHGLKDQRKQDIESLKEDYKLKCEEDKAQRKATADAQKDARKAMHDGLKARKSELKTYWKEQQTRRKNERKAKIKNRRQRKTSASQHNEALPNPEDVGVNSPSFPSAAEEKNALAANALYMATVQSQSEMVPPIVTQTTDEVPSVSSDRTRVPSTTAPSIESPKPAKERKFCNLPPKDSSGHLDPTWQRVYMEDVDEVGAHCGLFFPHSSTTALKGAAADQDWCERYASLISDVASRIEQWVHDDLTHRMITGVQAL